MGHQVTVITGEMDKIPDYLTQFFGREHMEERDWAYEDAYGVQILYLPLKGFVSGRAIFDKKRLLSEIRRLHPDVLFAHGNDTETSMWLLRYAIDPAKIHGELGWLPETKFADGIQKTIQWYLDNRKWWEDIISGEYQTYYQRMYFNR